MSGIGFELKKLFVGRGVVRKLRAYAYAGIICSGTMILAIALLLCLQQMAKAFGAGEHERELLVVTMVYAGLINKQIVASLQKIGCNALGLSGADGDSVPATKRVTTTIDWGYVGDVDPKKINVSLLHSLLAKGITPVFCAITHDGNGSLLNTNADTMASSIAIALASEYYVRLIYCFEKDGVLSDPKDNTSVIPLITQNSYRQLLDEGKVVDGMIPKLDNAFKALREGVAEVIIKHADNLLNKKETLLKL